jgi:tartrate-resistant acid phosphatase type 5
MTSKIIIIISFLISHIYGHYSFMSIGDWGCMDIGGYKAKDQKIVAEAFMKKADEINPKFILNTGDNFYYCGIQNLSDPNFQTTFEDVYNNKSVMVPWIGCLGNHDYGYPLSAISQINYKSKNYDRWMIPDRYYYTRLEEDNVNISIVVLDSSPCQSPYTSSNPREWDPCGSVIPGCPGCTFHENVIQQSCEKQYLWFKNITKYIPKDDWKIVMTHAPALDIDNEDFIPIIQETGFHIYINGHVHLLAHYEIDNIGTYISSGAGCMVKIPYDIPHMNSCSHYNKNHTCKIKYQETIAGYTTHTFNNDYSKIVTNFYNYDNKLLYQIETKK